MVPGITDTECRVAAFRYRERLASVERQRIASQVRPAQSDPAGLFAVIHGPVNTLMSRMSRSLQGIHSAEAAGATARTPALGAVQ